MLIYTVDCLSSDLWQYICNNVWPLLFMPNAKDIEDTMQELVEQAKEYTQTAFVSKHWYREMIKTRAQIRRLAITSIIMQVIVLHRNNLKTIIARFRLFRTAKFRIPY
jgi:hypothetical protein